MREKLVNIKSPFLVFKIEEENFLYDGGRGIVSQVSKIVCDIVRLLNLYDFSKVEDYKCFLKRLEKKYSMSEIDSALEYIVKSNEKGFLKDVDRLYNFYNEEYELEAEKSRPTALWLNVSHACNLRCTYCYGDGGSYNNDKILMNKETAKKCIDYWLKNCDKSEDEYNVIFFGGEPLLNEDVIYFAVNYINKVARDENKVINYTITTNGTIISEKIVNLIKNNKFTVVVSIDGLEEIHNRNRPFLTGELSFNNVIENIKTFKDIATNSMANMVVKREDIPFLKESVESLWNMGIESVNASLCFGKDDVYTYEDLEIWNNQIKELADITYNNLVNGKRLVLANLMESMRNITNKKLASCTLFNNGTFVFSADGDIYKCHRNVGNQKFKLANIDDKNIDILNHKLKKMKIEKCSNCWAQLLCDDGCPYEHELNTGSINKPSYDWCNKTKIMQKESLKLYVKLLKNSKKLTQ